MVTTTRSRSGARLRPRQGDRRRGSMLHLPERRCGFDRRKSYPLTGQLKDRPHNLAVLLVAVNTLSLLDFMLTWEGLQSGIAREANPVLAPLFAAGPAEAFLFKSATILGVTIAIWRWRHVRPVLGVAVFAMAAFSALLVYHLVGVRVAIAMAAF